MQWNTEEANTIGKRLVILGFVKRKQKIKQLDFIAENISSQRKKAKHKWNITKSKQQKKSSVLFSEKV